MEVSKMQWKQKTGWNTEQQNTSIIDADVILCFGGRSILEQMDKFAMLQSNNPNAEILYASTAGEIFDIDVLDDSVSVILMKFEHTPIRTVKRNLKDYNNSEEVGRSILEELNAPDLNHVFILSDGQLVNGAELLKGVSQVKNEKTIITGGLAGDGYGFKKTLVGLNGKPEEGNVVAIGYYGDRIKVGFGCKTGWEKMTTDRIVRRSKKNALPEEDGNSSLNLYTEYFGEADNESIGSEVRVPLSAGSESNQKLPVIHPKQLDIEGTTSMTFAGNIPQGYNEKMNRHNPDRLRFDAEEASQKAISTFENVQPDLALIVSCAGRKIVLGQHVDEEVEEVQSILGDNLVIAGFYSYGEIGPKNSASDCDLHTKTIAITTYTEI